MKFNSVDRRLLCLCAVIMRLWASTSLDKSSFCERIFYYANFPVLVCGDDWPFCYLCTKAGRGESKKMTKSKDFAQNPLRLTQSPNLVFSLEASQRVSQVYSWCNGLFWFFAMFHVTHREEFSPDWLKILISFSWHEIQIFISVVCRSRSFWQHFKFTWQRSSMLA